MNPVVKVSLTKDAYNVCDKLSPGDLLYVEDIRFYFCKRYNDKYDLVIEEELSPCLGTKCDKRDLCYKYNLSKKFSPDKVVIRDFSYKAYFADADCCEKNRYRLFRWDV